jgi:hypothetical protein
MKNIENQLLKDQMAEYIEYVQKLVEYSDIMEKRFFIVVPVDPPRAQKKTLISKFMSYVNPDDTVLNILKRRGEFKQLKKQLDTRLEVVLTAIGNCGLKVEPLKTSEIIELFYQVYNPQLARSQKLGDIEELSITSGPEENLVEEK